MTKRPTLQSTLAVASLLAFSLSGCGFFTSAGELTLSAEQNIPRIKQEILFPDVDKLTGGDLNDKIGATDPDTGKPLIAGVPTSLKKTTLAHIQGLLALAGQCRRTIEIDDIDSGLGGDDKKDPKTTDDKKKASSPVTKVAVTITNCTGDERCNFICKGWQGIEIEAGATIEILTETQAKDLATQLAKAGGAGTKNAADALVALRLLIYQLDLFQAADEAQKNAESLCNKKTTQGKIEAYRDCTTTLLDNFELVMQDALPYPEGQTAANEVPVIRFRHLAGVNPDNPRRFEVDANDPVTARVKELVVAKKSTKVRVVQRMRVKRPDLFEMNFNGGGLFIDLQPEVVVSVTELVKSLGGVN